MWVNPLKKTYILRRNDLKKLQKICRILQIVEQKIKIGYLHFGTLVLECC